jgi:hypothetical protein
MNAKVALPFTWIRLLLRHEQNGTRYRMCSHGHSESARNCACVQFAALEPRVRKPKIPHWTQKSLGATHNLDQQVLSTTNCSTLFDFADRTRGGISNVIWQRTPESRVKHAHTYMYTHKSPALTQVTRHKADSVTSHVSEVPTHEDCDRYRVLA